MLVVSFCKPVIHKLKILGGGKLEYYKSIGAKTKKKGGGKIWNFSGEKQKGKEDTIFDSNLMGDILEETMNVNTLTISNI